MPNPITRKESPMPTRQLARSRTNRIFAGVSGGIASYTGLDSGLVRLVTFLLVAFTGVGLVAYIAAWILLPLEGSNTSGIDTIITTLRNGTDTNPNPNDLR